MGVFKLGFCTWTVDRHDPRAAIERVGGTMGLHSVQVGFFGKTALSAADPGAIQNAAATAGLDIVGAFLGFDAEDYQSIASITATGGLLPDDMAEDRLRQVERACLLSRLVGAPSLAIHVGTIPSDHESDCWLKLRDRCRIAAHHARGHGLRLLLETGREPAPVLSQFIDSLGESNVEIGYDPANFVVYGTDDPVKAVVPLRERIGLVHLKDATRSPRPGVTYGAKAPFGTGDVMIPRVLSKLRAAGYAGPLLLEVDPGEDLSALSDAFSYLRSMLS